MHFIVAIRLSFFGLVNSTDSPVAKDEYFLVDDESLMAVRDAAIDAYPELASSPGVWSHLAEMRDSNLHVTIIFHPHAETHGTARVGLIRCLRATAWHCEENGRWILLRVSSQEQPVVLKGHDLPTPRAEEAIQLTRDAILADCGPDALQILAIRRYHRKLIVRYDFGQGRENAGATVLTLQDPSEGNAIVLPERPVPCPAGT